MQERRTTQNRENEKDGSSETSFIEGQPRGTISRLRESLFGAERQEKPRTPTGVMNFIKSRFPNVDFSQIKRMKQVKLLHMAQKVVKQKLSFKTKVALASNFLRHS